jgi:hypothetical protein
LPISEDAQGNPHFDSNAGILGAIKSAITLPGDAYHGKVDPISDEGIQRTLGLAGLVGPTNTFGSTIAGGAGMVAPTVAAPTADALKSAASSGYDAMRNMGVDYSSPAVSTMASGIRQGLERDGIIRELAPNTHAVLDKLENAPENSVAPLSSLDAARRSLGFAAKNFNNPTDQLAALRGQGGLEDFINNPTPQTVVTGPAGDAAATLQDARLNYGAGMRSDRLTGAADTADLNASVANSGMNFDNALRQRVAGILKSPQQSAGFSTDEIAALKDVASGTPSRNAIRYIGNLAGGGGGLGSVVATGMSGEAGNLAGGPGMGFAAAAGVPAVGYAAKKLANALTSRSLSAADELVRQHSPLYSDMVRAAPMVPAGTARNDALVRALMATNPPPNPNWQ